MKSIDDYELVDLSPLQTKEKVCVYCETKEESLRLLATMKKLHPDMCDSWYFPGTYFDRYPRICYNLGFSDNGRMKYGRYEYFVGEGYRVVSFSELFNQNDDLAIDDAEEFLAQVLGIKA